jgi:DNA invertase Pin-like site-specific DNA recombinase
MMATQMLSLRTNRGLLLNENQEQNSSPHTVTRECPQTANPFNRKPKRSRGVGCAKIFAEKISGAYSDRPQLAKALAALAEGDCLVVCKLDRLARSTRDLLNSLDTIGKAGATFGSLGDGWADTTTPHGRLMLTVLGGLAEFERHLILTRTSEGRTRARANGREAQEDWR